MLLAFGLQLPAAPPPTPPAGQSVPPPITQPAATEPWEPAWSQPLTSSAAVLLAASSDHVFTAGMTTPLEARAADTGLVAWTHDLEAWEALAATTTLVLGVSGGHAYALDAATGQTRWVTQTTGANTRLAIAAGRLLMVSDTDVLLRDLASGTPIWRAGLAAPPSARPGFTADAIAIATKDGVVVGLDASTGDTRWRADIGQPPVSVTATTETVFAGLPNGTLYALNNRNGSARWYFELRVPMVGAPATDDEAVYVTLLDNSLRSFDRSGGAMRRTDPLGHRPGSGPWIAGDTVIIAMTTGEFVVVDRSSGRTVVRLPVPDTDVPQLLQQAALGANLRYLASVTIAPGGARQLSAYQYRPPASVTTEETVTGPAPAPTTPAGETTPADPPPATPSPPVPQPFPTPR